MPPIKLLHLADIHIGMENYGRLDPEFGINSRIVDFVRRLSKAVKIALEQQVDLCLFAGDAYKNAKPSPTYQYELARRFKILLDAGIPLVLLVGNHDMANTGNNSLDIFDVLGGPQVIVADAFELHTITCRRGQTLQVATVPYPQRSNMLNHDDFKNLPIEALDSKLEALMSEELQNLAHQARQQPDLPAVLMGHFSVKEASLGSEQQVMIGRDVAVARTVLADEAWDYVALGHIHKHQELNDGQHPPIVYPGSLERIDFGEEAERKGFVMATVARGQCDWEFVPVNARPFITIRLDVREQADPMAAILADLTNYKIDDAVVRLIIKADEAQETLLDDRAIQQALERANHVASIVRDVERSQRSRLDGVATEELKVEDALTLYFQSKELSEERQAELLTYARELMVEEA